MAYILPRPSHFGEEATHRVYIRHMFISDQVKDLLPPWAFFVRAVVNARNLAPTASRESVYHNETFDAVRTELGDCLKQYLVRLSEQAPARLQQIVAIHNTALKSLALSDPAFLRFIADWFAFDTSLGRMTLAEIRQQVAQRQQGLYYVPDLDEFRQLSAIAAASDTLVVNAGYIYESDLLARLGELDTGRHYQAIDAEYFGNVLKELPLATYDRYRARLAHLQGYLDELGCEIDLKQFQPATIPALYHQSRQQQLAQDIDQIQSRSDDLWAGITGSVLSSPSTAYRAKLYLNVHNPLISRLLDQPPTATEKAILQTLHVNAMMMGHYPLQPAELQAMNSNLLFLLDQLS